MRDASSKIIVLANQPEARDAWDIDYIQRLLKEQRDNLDTLDDHLETLGGRYILKDARLLRAHASKLQRQLDKVSNWLDDKSEKDDANQEKLKKLQEKCKKLIDRSERFKKTVSDDMSDYRYEESKWRLNPLQAFGAIVGIVGGAIGIAKGQDEPHRNLILSVGGVFASVGIYAAFRQPINEAFHAAVQASVKVPEKVAALRKDMRASAVAMTLYASAIIKEKNDIVPRYPSLNTTRAKVVMASSL